MKKMLCLLIVLLLLTMTGCGDNNEQVQVEEPETPKADLVLPEPEAEVADPQGEDENQPAMTSDGEADEGQSPLDLLGAIQPQTFETMMVETEIYNVEGFQSKSIVYQKGENTRTEIEQANGPKQIVILQAAEGVTYQYAEGAGQGMKIVHGRPEEMMQAMDGQMEIPDLRDLETEMQEHMVVRREEINGEKVIYVEFKDLDQDLDQALVKMWYSEEYAYPFRYEFTINGELLMRTEVTKFEVNISLDDDLFQPPTDIDFMEINMEGGFTMPDMPDMPGDTQ